MINRLLVHNNSRPAGRTTLGIATTQQFSTLERRSLRTSVGQTTRSWPSATRNRSYWASGLAGAPQQENTSLCFLCFSSTTIVSSKIIYKTRHVQWLPPEQQFNIPMLYDVDWLDDPGVDPTVPASPCFPPLPLFSSFSQFFSQIPRSEVFFAYCSTNLPKLPNLCNFRGIPTILFIRLCLTEILHRRPDTQT